jgi:hypothetical protein
MRRTPLLLILFAGTAAWAGAQHGPDASVRVQMLNKNRVTLGLLVEDGLALADTDDVGRVKISRQAAETVRRDLETATMGQDADRVVELGEHLVKLFDDGLVPSLESATTNVPEGSPAMDELKAARKEAVRDAESTSAIDMAAGKLAGSGRVKDVAQKLHDAAEKVKVAAKK